VHNKQINRAAARSRPSYHQQLVHGAVNGRLLIRGLFLYTGSLIISSI